MDSSVTQVSLRREDARLVFLAIAYHLGRPGSELDRVTKQPVEHGLAEVARELQPQLRLAVATISLRPEQASRLQSGMLGSVTELKAYPMLAPSGDGGRMSTVPGFDRTLRHLFPEVEEDVENAMGVAERMLMLHRRLASQFGSSRRRLDDQPAAPEPERKRSWWPFRR